MILSLDRRGNFFWKGVDLVLPESQYLKLIDCQRIISLASKKEELFKVADKNGDGVVSMDELAALLV